MNPSAAHSREDQESYCGTTYAAKLLGMSRSTLRKKLDHYGIH